MSHHDEPEPDEEGDEEFAQPGSGSALRRATKGNPRIYPCPTCKKPNRLTRKDVLLHYQCDECADRAEGKYGEYWFSEKKKNMPTEKKDIDKHFLACVASNDIYSEPCLLFKNDLKRPDLVKLLEAWE